MEIPSGTLPQKLEAVRSVVSVKADATGKLPERIELVKAGAWGPGSAKGQLEITVADLEEMRDNLRLGLGLPVMGREGAAIDYEHMDWSKAAAWMREFEVIDGVLYATRTEWTPAGAQAVIDGEYKFISPSFYPRCRGMWHDHEDPEISAYNVLVGAGLTNIPFFQGLYGLKASRASSDDRSSDSMLYISADKGETQMPTLDEVRVKAPADLTDEDKKVLEENKTELSAAEQIAFGLDKPADDTPPADDPANQPTPNADDPAGTPPADDQQAKDIHASIKSGKMVLVEASRFNDMEQQVKAATEQLKTSHKEKVEAEVQKHVARGAIKADTAERWVNRIIADATVEEDLKALHSNELLAEEQGKDGSQVTASVDLEGKIKAAMEANKDLSYGEATRLVASEHKDLAKEHEKVVTGAGQ